jgi:ADP-ribosyl-[dinitrogen reductase] hydrolase
MDGVARTEAARADRARGVVYGLLVGDALGVPYEFHGAGALPPEVGIEMSPPPGFRRAHAGTPEGTWSDDGAQALALLDAALAGGPLPHGFAVRLVDWYRRGAFTPDGRVFDIGGTTGAAIRALEAGTEPLRAGPSEERSLGNGSLMRVAPLALVRRGEELIADSLAQSRVTHGHPVAQVCCAVYTSWIEGLLVSDGTGASSDRAGRAWDVAWGRVRGHVEARGWSEGSAALVRVDGELARGPVRGTGYVIHSLGAARHLLTSRTSYESIVKGAIALGDDTDTTAAIAGGAAGALFGMAGIPERWVAVLAGRPQVEALLTRVLEG